MNQQQIDAARGVIVAAFENVTDAQINDMIAAPFHDMVSIKQEVFAA